MAAEYPVTIPTIAANKADTTPTTNDHAAHHNKLAEEVVAIATELGVNPSGSFADVATLLTRATRYIYAESYGFTFQGNGVNVDTAMTNLVNDLASATPAASVVILPPGIFDLTASVAAWGANKDLSHVLFVGAGSSANHNASPNRYRHTTIRANLVAGAPLFTYSHTTTWQTPPVWMFTDFRNIGHADTDCFQIEDTNNSGWFVCGLRDFRRAFDMNMGTADCAHNWFFRCTGYGNKRMWHAGATCKSNHVIGGEITGDGATTSVGMEFLAGSQAWKVTDTKFVGCLGGAITCAGGLMTFTNIHAEDCSTAALPAIDISTNAVGTSGAYNRIICPTIDGDGTNAGIRFQSGCNENVLIGATFTSIAASLRIVDSGALNTILCKDLVKIPGPMNAYLDIGEISAPAAPAANTGRLYVEDNGAGKTRLVVRFPTGAAQVLATEP